MTHADLKKHADTLTARAAELERNLAQLSQSHAAARDQLIAVRGAIQAVQQLADIEAGQLLEKHAEAQPDAKE